MVHPGGPGRMRPRPDPGAPTRTVVHAPPPPSRRARLLVGALALGTFVASLLLAAWLFPHLSANNDEAVYVSPGEDHLSRVRSRCRPSRSPTSSGRGCRGRATGGVVFQPVFPATLVLAHVVFGTMRGSSPASSPPDACCVLSFTYAALRDERIAVLAAAVMALSPLTLVHSAMYLEYLYAVLLSSRCWCSCCAARAGGTPPDGSRAWGCSTACCSSCGPST